MVDEALVATLKLNIIAGRNFSKAFNDSASMTLNASATKLAGWKKPIGKHIVYPGGDNKPFKVIGIAKDFNARSLQDRITPWALFYTKSGNYLTSASDVAVRLRPGDYAKVIAKIQSVWKTFLPEYPFDYNFLDQQYDELYKTDQTMGKVFSAFTLLLVIVACMGLFGLAMHTAERRTKEIGIRKVLGATTGNVVVMLSKDVLKLVIIASLIAIPIAAGSTNYWTYVWLFAYGITIL